MGKSPCREKNDLVKKGPWTPEEDKKMMDYIHSHGHGKWRTLPKNAGLKRCGKSCRLRWTNYLRPDIKRGTFSLEEEEIIIRLHSILGNKWSVIAAHLPGRTDNEIKNYWNTHIRKRLLKMGIDPITHIPRVNLLQLSSILTSSFNHSNHPTFLPLNPDLINQNLLNLVSSLLEENLYNPFENNTIQSYPLNQIHHPNLETQLVTPSNTLCASSWMGKHEQSYPDIDVIGCSDSNMDWWESCGQAKNLAIESSISLPNLGFCDLDEHFNSTFRNQTSTSNNIVVDSQSHNSSFIPGLSTSSSSVMPKIPSSPGSFYSDVFMYDHPN